KPLPMDLAAGRSDGRLKGNVGCEKVYILEGRRLVGYLMGFQPAAGAQGAHTVLRRVRDLLNSSTTERARSARPEASGSVVEGVKDFGLSSFGTCPLNSVFPIFSFLACRSRASPTSVGAPNEEVGVSFTRSWGRQRRPRCLNLTQCSPRRGHAVGRCP